MDKEREARVAKIMGVLNAGRFHVTDGEVLWLIEQLRAEDALAQEALEVIATLVDYDDCRLDHHGHCQTHGCGNPCDMAEAWTFLKAHDVPDGESSHVQPRAVTLEK